MIRMPHLLPRANVGLAAAAAAGILASCCAACGTNPAARVDPPASSATSAPGRAESRPAGLRTIDGATVQVPSGKPSVLAFISIGCADCSAAAKAVAQAAVTLGNRATVIGVDMDPGVPPQTITSFLDYVGAKNLPVVIDDAKFTLTKTYGVAALSSVLVVNPAGKVTFRKINPSAAAIAAAVTATS